jgi:tetratricopeptide (TPR) repeat protein
MDRLLERIRSGHPSEQGAAMSELIGRAEKSGDKRDWGVVAMALFEVQRFDEAIAILDQLVQESPDEDGLRLSLATSYSQTGQVASCCRHLAYVAEHGGTEEFRQTGREQLEEYERFVGLTKEDGELRRLQVAALHKATAREDCPADDFLRLAKLFTRAAMLQTGEGSMEESCSVLEAGIARYPRDVKLHEHLVHAYLHNDPKKRLNATLRKLERLAPNSQVFRVLSEVNDEDGAAWSRDMEQRQRHLISLVFGDDPAARESALSELALIVERYPENSVYRLNYGFALSTMGKLEEAAKQARILENLDDSSHSFHFNLGQIFYFCDEPESGRAHLELAARYANDEQERSDAWNMIQQFEKRLPTNPERSTTGSSS